VPHHGTAWHDGCWIEREKRLNPMDDADIRIMSVAETRQALTRGDIKSEVAFQHDVNRLLASLDELFDPNPRARSRSNPQG
jgi:hypothetical protein